MFSQPSWSIAETDNVSVDIIQAIIDSKTKPPGSLGRLEHLALRIAKIQSVSTDNANIEIANPMMLVFAADHGIASHGVSIAPSDVTQQMVHNFLTGGAAINCLCRLHDMSLKVIDAGMLAPLSRRDPAYFEQRLGPGTGDISIQAAMTMSQLEEGLIWGAKIVKSKTCKDSNVIGFGEMGIGNTSSAAALMCAMFDLPASQVAGRGTGINDTQFALKVSLIDKALQRTSQDCCKDVPRIYYLLASLGGFEIVQMIGAMLACAELKKTIIVDGYISSVAALYACNIAPLAREYMVFSHVSAEKSHRLLLGKLDATPLLDLELRLGEGTGAALALPLLRSAAAFFNQMATFESANINV